MNVATVLSVLCFAFVVSALLPLIEASLLCEGKWQANGSLVFAIPPGVSGILQNPSCDGQLISDGKVRVQYGRGEMEDFTDPVKWASVHRFTMSACPNSAYILAECPAYTIFRNVTCYCQSRLGTTESSTSETSPLTSNKVKASASLHAPSVCNPALFAFILAICLLHLAD